MIKERLLHHAIERSSWRYKKTRCHWDKDRYLHTEALGKNNLQEIKNLKAQAQTQTNQLRMGGVTLGCIKSINIFKTYVTAAWLCQSKSFKNITSFLNFDCSCRAKAALWQAKVSCYLGTVDYISAYLNCLSLPWL